MIVVTLKKKMKVKVKVKVKVMDQKKQRLIVWDQH